MQINVWKELFFFFSFSTLFNLSNKAVMCLDVCSFTNSENVYWLSDVRSGLNMPAELPGDSGELCLSRCPQWQPGCGDLSLLGAVL
jgi:hypothetical protein